MYSGFRRIITYRTILTAMLWIASLLITPVALSADSNDFNYLVGRGIRDITGPAVGVQLWGFVREGQVSEGIHFRLWSRAFVMADPETDTRLVFVSADVGSITHALRSEVVDRLRANYGDTYTFDNVILSATHTHSGPGGYWHYGVDSPIGSPFLEAHYDAIVEGIVDSIRAAHDDLQPGAILVNRGTVNDAGANRSMTAYLNNPEEERARYAGPTDTDMTLLKFIDATGAMGALNWFAVHPTSMTYDNKLISGDHKGNASYEFEKREGTTYAHASDFVAGFAQSNCGDVTANLNLDNTGPGEDEFETTHIIAERQLQVAVELFDNASDVLSGPIDIRHTYIDLSGLAVNNAYTHAGPQSTCPSAYGYSFAAGSTEDGGGNPLFKEGVSPRNAMVDNLITEQFKIPPPSDGCRDCQSPKTILLAPGELDPPGQSQIVPITLARIGQVVLVAVPAEFTTMAGRRLRETVAGILGADAKYVVLAGYANDYAGYVTTKEEYDTQQYEGGHTLFGPWTLSAYQQEFSRLARAMVEGTPVEPGPTPREMRGQVTVTSLGIAYDALPSNSNPGDIVAKAKRSYKRGDRVEVTFWSGHPQNAYQTGGTYLKVERQEGESWTTVATDNDWETRCWWTPDETEPTALRFTATWDIRDDATVGTYRIVHLGSFKRQGASAAEPITGTSNSFRVK